MENKEENKQQTGDNVENAEAEDAGKFCRFYR